MAYNIYYLRANQTKFAALISLAVRLGILSVSEDGITYAPEGAYDYIGTIPTFSDTPDENGLYAKIGIKQNPAGEDLYHANLSLPYSLNAVGTLIAAEDTETAAVFSALQEYFVVSSDTNEVMEPLNPARVFLDKDKLPIPAPYVPEGGNDNEWTLQ